MPAGGAWPSRCAINTFWPVKVPDHPEVLHLLGVARHQAGDQEAAVRYIGRAIALSGGEAIYHNSLGNVYTALERLDEAVACYEQALHIQPRLAEAHNNLGAARQAQGDAAEAEACYRRALQLKPDYADAHNNLGNILKAAGEPRRGPGRLSAGLGS